MGSVEAKLILENWAALGAVVNQFIVAPLIFEMRL